MSAEPQSGISRRLDQLFRITEALDGAGTARRITQLRQAEALYRHYRRRDEIMGNDLFANPAVDILLELYIVTLKAEIAGLDHAYATLPRNDRYLPVLKMQGLIDTAVDEGQCDQVRLWLTPKATALMDRVVAANDPR